MDKLIKTACNRQTCTTRFSNAAPHFPQKFHPRTITIRTPEPPAATVDSIYVVDDEPFLTQLYMALLAPAGYLVSTFHERARALMALKADRRKPNLLITDYLGSSMPAERFMYRCRLVHPHLRILMVSGCSFPDLRFSRVTPDHFMQKPFTIEQFRKEVSAALAA